VTRLRRIIAVFSILSFGLIASLVSDSQLAAGGDETQDARAYARSFGVPVDEALRRLRLQPNAGMLQQLLLEQEAATFAGLWIDNGSPYRVFAGFTRDGDRVLPSYAAAAGLRGIVVAVQASYSLNELNRDLNTVIALAHEVGAAASVNVRDNRVDLLVVSADAVRIAAQRMGIAIPATVRVSVTAALPHPVTDIYGGLPLDLSGCTTGFGISNNGTPDRGVTTAAHCRPYLDDTYQGTTIWFQRQAAGGAHDEKWLLANSFQVRNIINDGLGGRFITSRTPRSQQVVGGSVCRYGRTSGYNCGQIQSTSYLPPPTCESNSTPTYISVTPSTGQGGDSGGPEFLSNSAFGHTVCAGGVDVYVAVDTMEAGLSVTVLTSP